MHDQQPTPLKERDNPIRKQSEATECGSTEAPLLSDEEIARENDLLEREDEDLFFDSEDGGDY
jgi:hypothetical protein